MKKMLTHIGTLLMVATVYLTTANAQCPPPGYETPTATCSEAPVFCDGLGNYCDTMGVSLNIEAFPGCPASVLNNMSYIKFIAASDSLAIRIIPSDCQGLFGQSGMQGAIYEECGGAVLATQCNCTTQNFTLASGNFIVGTTYVLVLDGCAGDVCNYEIEVLFGSTNGEDAPVPSPGQILGSDTTCTQEQPTYAAQFSYTGIQYNWYLDPPGAGTISTLSNEAEVSVNWAENGQFKICVQTSNACAINPDVVCKEVVVTDEPIPDAAYYSLCEGQCLDLPDGQTVCEEGVYDVLVPGNNACDTIRSYVIDIIETTTVELPEQIACGEQFTICNQVLHESGSYLLTCMDPPGCDSLLSFDLTLLNPIVNIQPPAKFCLAGVVLDGSASAFSEGNGIVRQVSWEGPPGGLAFGVDSLVATATLPGTYCLTIYEEKNGQSCQNTQCVEVEKHAFNLPDFIQLCEGEAVELNIVAQGLDSVLWSTGDTLPSITVTSSGVYTVEALDTAGCVYADTVQVVISSEPFTGLPDTVGLCPLDSVKITAAAGFEEYLWSNGATGASIMADAAGWYYLIATTPGGCQITDSVYVMTLLIEAIPLPTHPICTTDYPFAFTAPAGYEAYSWSNGDNTQTAHFDAPGMYNLTALQPNGCYTTGVLTLVNTTFDVLNFPDTFSVCDQESPVSISLPSGYSYQWSTGSTSNNVTLEAPMSYSVTATNAEGCFQQDSFLLTARPVIGLPSKYHICEDLYPASLEVDSGFAGYLWNTGVTAPELYVIIPGTYAVTVTDHYGCTAADSTEVITVPLPEVTLPDTELALCEEDFPYELKAEGSFNFIFWSTGDLSQSIQVAQPGTYSVTVTGDYGCSDSESISISQQPPPMAQNPLHDTTICIESLPVTFDAGPGQALYLWNTGDQTQTTTLDEEDIPEPGVYLISLLLENEDGCRNVEGLCWKWRCAMPPHKLTCRAYSASGPIPPMGRPASCTVVCLREITS